MSQREKEQAKAYRRKIGVLKRYGTQIRAKEYVDDWGFKLRIALYVHKDEYFVTHELLDADAWTKDISTHDFWVREYQRKSAAEALINRIMASPNRQEA